MPLYVSAGIVLTEAEEASELNPIILWDNVAVTVTAASSEVAGHPVSHLLNPATHLYWQGGVVTGDEYVTVSSLSTQVNSVGIARHNFGTEGITVSVEVDDGSSPQTWVEVIAEHIPADDSPLLYRFTLDSYVSVRVRLQVPVGASPEIGVLYVGELLTFERSIDIGTDHTPINQGRQTRRTSRTSIGGNFLGRVVLGETRATTLDFKWLTPEFYRSDVDPFMVAAQEIPFFVAWNPSEYSTDVGYCWIEEGGADPAPEIDPATRRVHLTLRLQGVA